MWDIRRTTRSTVLARNPAPDLRLLDGLYDFRGSSL
jgi:hypothetical protein